MAANVPCSRAMVPKSMCVRPSASPHHEPRRRCTDEQREGDRHRSGAAAAAAGTRESPSNGNVPASSAASPATTAAAATTWIGEPTSAPIGVSHAPPRSRMTAVAAEPRRATRERAGHHAPGRSRRQWKWTALTWIASSGRPANATSCRCSTKKTRTDEEGDARADRGDVGRTADRP